MGYPGELEEIWLKIAREATGKKTPGAALGSLEREAGAISDAFTTGRDPSFAGYATKRRAIAAYGVYFFPRAFERMRLVMNECRSELPDARPFRILDLGAGTGGAGFAAAHELAAPAHVTLVDRAQASLDAAVRVFREGRSLWPEAKLNAVCDDARSYRPEGPYDLIICSFALNEWMEGDADDERLFEWVKDLMNRLSPRGLLALLEPAQHALIDRVIRLRDRFAHEKAGRIVAPCPHHAPCPMHAQKRGWCHEVRNWRPPKSMHHMNRNLQRDIKLLKFSFLVLGRDQSAPADWMRIVSGIRKEKGKFSLFACGGDGNIHTCEWLTRKLSAEDIERSEQLERGDRVVWKAAKVLGDGVTERSDGPPDAMQ